MLSSTTLAAVRGVRLLIVRGSAVVLGTLCGCCERFCQLERLKLEKRKIIKGATNIAATKFLSERENYSSELCV